MLRSLHRQGIAIAIAWSIALLPVTSQMAWAQSKIGATQIVVNDVRGVMGTQQPAPLRAGIDVFPNEVIRTGGASASRVVFQDNTNLSVGASSQVTLDRFVFDPDPAKSQVALSIAKGVVRFTTGSLPKTAYQITTPTATIGVRGTILTITVAADGTTTVAVEEGIALVTGASQTVTVNAGSSTTVGPNAPPSPPAPSPPAPPMVAEMDSLLSPLPAGAAAGSAANTATWVTVGIFGIFAVLGIVLATSGGGGGLTTGTVAAAPTGTQ